MFTALSFLSRTEGGSPDGDGYECRNEPSPENRLEPWSCHSSSPRQRLSGSNSGRFHTDSINRWVTPAGRRRQMLRLLQLGKPYVRSIHTERDVSRPITKQTYKDGCASSQSQCRQGVA
ncbi:uncharacterized [Tachysurus ichikawai]